MLNLKVLLLSSFLLSSISFSSAMAADRLDENGILRRANGEIHQMTFEKAMEACPEGTRVPTAREMAEWSQKRGAKGILELSEIDWDVPPDQEVVIPDGYVEISAKNPDGTIDIFYFNSNGYKPLQGESTQESWTSSVHSEDVKGARSFDGFFGGFTFYTESYIVNAVRCVR